MEKLTYYWKKLRQNKLAYNFVLIAAIILAMAVTAHFVMQVGTRHGARRIVPDFSGVKLDDAQRTSRKYDLELHINDSLFVPAYEGGIVLDQLPEGGVEVKPGRTVYITINSFRQKMVPVPYVAGRSLRQAKVDFDEGINLLNQKDARVYVQVPTAERSAALGSRVDLKLTLDEKKLAQHRATAEKQAREAAEERLRLERERADSLAQAEFEQAAAAGEEQPEILPATDNDGFFD